MTAVADICLLLEGTYPYVRGGVSAWIQQLIEGLPECSFALVFIGGQRRDYPSLRYELPANVVHFEQHFLDEALKQPKLSSARTRCPHSATLSAAHRYLKACAGHERVPASELQALEGSVHALLDLIEQPRGVALEDFVSSPEAWQLIRDTHMQGPDTSFVDYFWTLRFMHGPLFQLARIARQVPAARAFHAISTGYAGFLGALLQRRSGRALILSEHGIYTKERRIDLNHAAWLDGPDAESLMSLWGSSSSLRELWIRFFESLGRLTYAAADPIISLYEGNRTRQHADGASALRTRVIVNGIDSARFAAALQQRTAEVPRVVGLVGRVVPIKDVKTFIRAMQLVNRSLPGTQGWIIGSAEEDPAYGEECQALVRSLDMTDNIRFLGHQNVALTLPRLGLLMLTSISEAQPLAILEALAAGVPCVATDVGACREQIEGGSSEDRALGKAGRVVPFADAQGLAQAAVELLSSHAAWTNCQRAGLARVQKHYALTEMLNAYRQAYQRAVES
jgi:glycosyltransferase involved in cell wall biosynthesis